MISKSSSAFRETCPCCGRRDFLVAGFYATAVLALSRAIMRAADVAPDAAAAINPIKNAIPYAARPLPLAAVRLTGGPLKQAQELAAKNLLHFDADRLLYNLRKQAGLDPKADSDYGGWESGRGRQLVGAMAGHYLSGLSYMYAATGDEQFKTSAQYMVDEFKAIQDAQGDGYIGGQMNAQNVPGKTLFQEIPQGTITSGGFDLNGMWSPWYVEHKIFAGLRDAYRQAGLRPALDVSIKLAGWVDRIVGGLSDDQTQKMLGTEFGGINESLADLYADTGDQRWLTLSAKFKHQAIVGPLANDQDILGGKHGNTQIPKLIGEYARYIYAGAAPDGEAGRFFWNAVVYHHSFSTGGHGYDEAFGQPDKLSGEVDGTAQRNPDLRTCESCNVYNMVKLSRLLFSIEPDIKFADFHERALFNHVLASIDFDSGQVCYMVPVGQGVTHEYQGVDGVTCCAGTGLESHGLHGYGIYYEKDDKFWVNLFAPSTAQWKDQGVDFAMETNFPTGESATLKITAPSPKEFTLALRRPAWAGDGFALTVNGEVVKDLAKAGSYAEIKRTWKTGDTVAITLPKSLHKEALPDNANRVALMWGPLVLGADHGAAPLRGARYPQNPPVKYPVFLAEADEPVDHWLKRVPENMSAAKSSDNIPVTFHAVGVNGANNEVDFRPFYQLSQRRYSIYWDVYTPEELQQKNPAAAAEIKLAKLNAVTVAYVQPGQMQPEHDYNFQGEESSVIVADTPGRWGTKWFSFDVPVDPAHPMTLLITYNSGDPVARTFDISIDGTRLKAETIAPAPPAKLYDVEYALPADLVKGKQKITVRFDATGANGISAVYGLRMIRGDAER
jgi:DUF1680 family protein